MKPMGRPPLFLLVALLWLLPAPSALWRGPDRALAQTVTNDQLADSSDDDESDDGDDDSSGSDGSDDDSSSDSGSGSSSDDDDDGPNTNSGSRSKDHDDDDDEEEEDDEGDDEGEADDFDLSDPFDRAFREDRDHDSYVADEILVANASVSFLQQVQALGFRILEVRRLAALGLDLVRLSTPRGTTALGARRQLAERFPDLVLDVNGLYGLQQSTVIGSADAIRELIDWPLPCRVELTIGMLDTAVDKGALRDAGSAITVWTPDGAASPPGDHGTGVASILLGSASGEIRAMVDGATLVVAAVFEGSPDRPAEVIEVVAGLDWLASAGARVVNLSIAGEPSPILQIALSRTMEKGIVAVAAVGNAGPSSPPLWPAAEPGVIAVTAIDASATLYPQAVRGGHVDLAAPGVNVPALSAGGQRSRRTGTSYAAPFVTAAAAVLLDGGTPAGLVEAALAAAARDLGPDGGDTDFGSGLLTRPNVCRETS